MNMTNIDQNLLYRYFAKETSHEENAAVGEWLRSDEMHQKEFDKELKMFLLLHFAANGKTIREIETAEAGLARKNQGSRYSGESFTVPQLLS